ncbi:MULTISPECIES: oligopeptide/dipeptide ABC transporter ATP-binding protein [Gammaproteobacteria]|uniref:oligopeptide/dipeptide ABC transporter ATP-binding protein n=1 Tax=Gammaproteobacteria TaxID=1236 RepID=UPI000DD0A79B|nr:MULTISPECIES: oligopeptide/dipeptide ABC transporter ATP-binding protein [Gammaproteobacteria]RTE87133.1 ATP-binding cassette domain-containing protein [Aliidiomarina sp. B3213]TCZ93079.1 ATP-binding cassette domain-containing protein [Lysobacter sp. N42]
MLIDIRNLSIFADTPQGEVRVLDRVSLQIAEGEIHTLVGESGSGKSLVARAIMGFVNPNWRIQADRLWFKGTDLLNLTAKQRREIIGVDIAMIFQDAARYLDPNTTIREQLKEAILDEDVKATFWTRSKAKDEYARNLLLKMGVKNYEQVLASYPFELSDGAAQKVMIATAIAHRPHLLIADEPTTAMEPLTRAQIYRLLAQLHQRFKMSILVITQDLNTIMQETDRITTIYCGQIMETGHKNTMLTKPLHPYTDALNYTSLVQTENLKPRDRLKTLPGIEPTLQNMPKGCRLGPRCRYARQNCIMRPEITNLKEHSYYCHHPIREFENSKNKGENS